MKKVDIVVYPDGERKVVGTAFVEVDGSYISVDGKLSDPEYVTLLSESPHSEFSIGPFRGAHAEDRF